MKKGKKKLRQKAPSFRISRFKINQVTRKTQRLTDDQTQKIVDNPQGNNDSDDEENNAIDLEPQESISQRVLLQ